MRTIARSCSSVNGRFAAARTCFSSSFSLASGFAPDGCWAMTKPANRRIIKIAAFTKADHSSEMNYCSHSGVISSPQKFGIRREGAVMLASGTNLGRYQLEVSGLDVRLVPIQQGKVLLPGRLERWIAPSSYNLDAFVDEAASNSLYGLGGHTLNNIAASRVEMRT